MAGSDDIIARGERLARMVWQRLGLSPAIHPHSGDVHSGSGMDRLLTPPPVWRRYAPYAGGAVILIGFGVWLL